jgi:cellulose synthase/poly-beta-1,6-N-acetylglucosamine synthase-like glycosyltransferase
MGADVVYQKGRGKGDAIRTAVERIDVDVDYVVFTDADYTYPVGYIPLMIEVSEGKPHVGMVGRNRFNDHLDARALHNLLYIDNRILAFTHNIFNGVRMRDPLIGTRVMRAEILRDWRPRSTGFDVEVELNHHV